MEEILLLIVLPVKHIYVVPVKPHVVFSFLMKLVVAEVLVVLEVEDLV